MKNTVLSISVQILYFVCSDWSSVVNDIVAAMVAVQCSAGWLLAVSQDDVITRPANGEEALGKCLSDTLFLYNCSS